MANNTFGNIFRFTTWGESHGKTIGVVVDGCPAGLHITEQDINTALQQRAPGRNLYTSPRTERDQADILSGIFDGQTTGAPISIMIKNTDVDSSSYEPLKDLLRPGHANFTYLKKYGIFDYRGGGRASARETAARVAAGAIAKKFLSQYSITLTTYIYAVGGISITHFDPLVLQSSPIFCPDATSSAKIIEAIEAIKKKHDSLGGVIECRIEHVPVGLGDPIYNKLEAKLAQAMLSIPASKGFEIGSGFSAAQMKGSEHNDPFIVDTKGNITTTTNHSGGTLGGISTGLPIIFRVPFKPTSSIGQSQETLDLKGLKCSLELSSRARHDPCVAIRAVPVVEAMAACVLADSLLSQRCSHM